MRDVPDGVGTPLRALLGRGLEHLLALAVGGSHGAHELGGARGALGGHLREALEVAEEGVDLGGGPVCLQA